VDVDIERRVFGTNTFKIVGSTIADESGAWSFTARARKSASYVAAPQSNGKCEGRASSPIDVLVQAKILIHKRTGCRIAGDVYHPGQVRGKVLPAARGTEIYLDARRGGKWRRDSKTTIGKGSRFRLHTFSCGRKVRLVWDQQSVTALGAMRTIRVPRR
jgi:hypothetical protein